MLIPSCAFGLAALLVVLGFVALLKQKTYLDPASRQPIQVEVPILGRVKTNYPALIFVLLGFALAWVAFDKAYPPRQATWTVKGSFRAPNGQNGHIDWNQGTLTLTPALLNTTLNDQGRFEMRVEVEEGKSIEDAFETLDFSHAIGSAQIDLQKALAAYRQGETNLIASLTPHSVTFNPIDLQLYPTETSP